MAPSFAWTTAALAAALAHGAGSAHAAAPAATAEPVTLEPVPTSPATPAEDPGNQPDYLVRLAPGPELARRMGTRVILRPIDKNPTLRRSAVALELPRPASSDDPPASQHVELPAGIWRIEVSAPGFLPSTREFTVDATRPQQTLAWDLLPDTLSADVIVATTAAGQPAVAVTATSADGRKTWSCVSRHAPCVLRLGRGGWYIEARARGFATRRGALQVATDRPQTLPLTLTPGDDGLSFGPGPPGPSALTRPASQDIRKRADIGLGVAAIPVFGVGLALTIVGRNRYVRAIYGDTCDRGYGPACGNSLIPPIHLTGVGVGSLGASAGLLVASITGAFEVKRSTWWILLGVGGGLSLVGAAWVGGNSVFLDRDLRSGPLTAIDGRVDRRLVASVILGLGLGSATGALTHALALRRHQRPQVAPYASPGQAGLLLTGRF
jgi:hypothetical protein